MNDFQTLALGTVKAIGGSIYTRYNEQDNEVDVIAIIEDTSVINYLIDNNGVIYRQELLELGGGWSELERL